MQTTEFRTALTSALGFDDGNAGAAVGSGRLIAFIFGMLFLDGRVLPSFEPPVAEEDSIPRGSGLFNTEITASIMSGFAPCT